MPQLSAAVKQQLLELRCAAEEGDDALLRRKALEAGQLVREALSDTAEMVEGQDASLTKMMTLYMVFEALERGAIKLNTRIKFSANAAKEPPTKLGVGAGRSITVEQGIYAIAVACDAVPRNERI